MTTPIIIDCDPGHDDAFALMLAVASPELELVGVTTVAGNQTLEKTTANALRVLELCGRGDVPVAAGAADPLVRARDVAAHVHGETGLDGPDLPPPASSPSREHAVDFLARADPGAGGGAHARAHGAARRTWRCSSPCIRTHGRSGSCSWAARSARETARRRPSSTSGPTRRRRAASSRAGSRRR